MAALGKEKLYPIALQGFVLFLNLFKCRVTVEDEYDEFPDFWSIKHAIKAKCFRIIQNH